MSVKCVSNFCVRERQTKWPGVWPNNILCEDQIKDSELFLYICMTFFKKGLHLVQCQGAWFHGSRWFRKKKKRGGGKSRRTHHLEVLPPPEKRVSLRPILVFFVRSFVRELEMNLIKRNNNCAHKFSLQAERETRKMEEKTLKLVGEGEKKHTHQHQSWMQIKTHRVLLFLSFFSLIKIQ